MLPAIQYRARIAPTEGPPATHHPSPVAQSCWELLSLEGERLGSYPTYLDALFAVRRLRPRPRHESPVIARHWLEGPAFARADIQVALWVGRGTGRLRSDEAWWWRPGLRPRDRPP